MYHTGVVPSAWELSRESDAECVRLGNLLTCYDQLNISFIFIAYQA